MRVRVDAKVKEEEVRGLAYIVSVTPEASCFQREEKMSLCQSTLGPRLALCIT